MKNIETIENCDKLLYELKQQNMIFNLNKFYSSENIKESLCSGAIQIIMPNHEISFFANDSHRLAAENVYKVLYKEKDGFTSDIWQEEICLKNSILFQFNLGSFSLAWFPKRITPFQLKKTICNCILIDEINKKALNGNIKLSKMFSKHRINNQERYITVETNVFDSDNNILSLHEAIPIVKTRVYSRKK
ncbi:MAG: hypothetical protein IKG27_04280 [Bacilli bacterium]|nr:hypothetical protein [Bacilli bacterium]